MNPRDLRQRVSDNFLRGEFEVADSHVQIHEEIVRIAQMVRTYIARPLHITSGVRTPEHNLMVGGSATSSHLLGLACDISDNNKGRDMQPDLRFDILSRLLVYGVPRIGIAKTFIHFDIDPSKPQGVVWLY